MLKVENLHIHYGAIEAVKGIDFEVKKGEIVTLIGANGAGKTSVLKAISGLVKPSSGSILYLGKSLEVLSAQKIHDLKLGHVPEGRHIFADMTVIENLELGAYQRKDKAGIKEDLAFLYERFPILKQRSKQAAGTLSGGEQQMLAMARALMARPELLLLDEPSMGLAPILVNEIFSIIKDINDSGTTILLVEQNARKALAIADRGYVMETGRIVMSGDGASLAASEQVQKAYLGG